jgi:YggT family protein
VFLVCRLLEAYVIIMFARIILSWFPISPSGGLSTIYGFLFTLTEPVLGPIRRIIPPLGMGGMGFDLSPLIVLLAIGLIRGAIC